MLFDREDKKNNSMHTQKAFVPYKKVTLSFN